MAKELERDLGLPSVLAISIGAMVGSGIFILPALAMKMAGPAVVLAYLLAGVLVLPSALSKAEMATAMPEAGGTYVYIERGMGPLLGTIAGIGTWFSLSFKGALALVGGAPYIVLLFDVPPQMLALGIAGVLIGVNLLGVKQTGRIQVALVGVMLAAMGWFVGGSLGDVDPVRFDGFFEGGLGGLLAATGFVYVSYAGVTKVASVAEEIEHPDRNIPLGLLGSLAFTTLLYVLVVTVIVGAAPTANLAGSSTPVADVAGGTLVQWGVLVIVVAAILALVSTANAGLLSASRYPFAMSRDKLVPDALKHVSDRFDTPTTAITLTGGVMLAMIAFVPIDDIAKLGSAFKILVFILVNLALVAFRESDLDDYDPAFRDPLYPWTQGVGVLGGLVLLSQMGLVPLVEALVITGSGALWYGAYARRRVEREGVMQGELRRRVGAQAAERTRMTFDTSSTAGHVVVGVTEDLRPDRETALVEMGAALAEALDGRLTVVRFDAVPDQLPLKSAAEIQSPDDVDFETRMDRFRTSFDGPFEYGEVVSHDVRHAVANFARHHEVNLLVLERILADERSWLNERDLDWISRHCASDLVLVEPTPLTVLDRIALVTDSGPFDPRKVELANGLASAAGARLVLVHAVPAEATEDQRATIRTYHDDLMELCTVSVGSMIVDEEAPDAVARAVSTADLIVVESDENWWARLLDRREPQRIAEAFGGPAIVVRPQQAGGPGLVRRVLERLAL
ncbi:APC family permease [Salinibacter altiplanensis]|uniref:APC family permease n=1 Tax=Salinibacter altiplanensis TaxID=1803181 RepID=UPI000C9F40C7|nr:APC family permease [Salinibacter altiplanensis]